MKYVALARGINVGGNNKINMAELKQTFENIGFTSVVTYINSGNVIFDDDDHSMAEIVDMIEVAIELNFELQIKITLRDKDNIKNLVGKLNNAWVNDDNTKSEVMFLSNELDKPAIMDELNAKDSYARATYIKGAIAWSCARVNIPRGGSKKVAGGKLYKQVTARNTNTVRKIAELMGI